ncbi:hypothetical protein BpHYR1_037454 [Brachionus plicatilis]|uniref:Uncharacterized protein n=1 Tax=Brachionus plicatilis TaxID=10195 RepID=A0A3M7SFJ0_BRAPC|nr:hypothetical protein BpHYR1_037454 [Brachionus plicatilis]
MISLFSLLSRSVSIFLGHFWALVFDTDTVRAKPIMHCCQSLSSEGPKHVLIPNLLFSEFCRFIAEFYRIIIAKCVNRDAREIALKNFHKIKLFSMNACARKYDLKLLYCRFQHHLKLHLLNFRFLSKLWIGLSYVGWSNLARDKFNIKFFPKRLFLLNKLIFIKFCFIVTHKAKILCLFILTSQRSLQFLNARQGLLSHLFFFPQYLFMLLTRFCGSKIPF